MCCTYVSEDIWRTLAGILMLGNIDFEGEESAVRVNACQSFRLQMSLVSHKAMPSLRRRRELALMQCVACRTCCANLCLVFCWCGMRCWCEVCELCVLLVGGV